MVDGRDHRHLAENYFPGGSFGNGAAMRVAPVGILFRDDPHSVWEEAHRSALPTHVHPLGIEGAQLTALAVALASSTKQLDRVELLEMLASKCTSIEFSGPLRRAALVNDAKDLALFGNGIEATASVVTAIASFALTPNSFEETIGNAILLGGDTDTIAAMAGAISGAYLGEQSIPRYLMDHLEDGQHGKTYIRDLAIQLHAVYQSARNDDADRVTN
jgi:poly(ADP-ribose) glycohydrolase ARH3